ncbi:MAG: ABC transporter substrate-binding protein [Myxococcales bacterium]|nr:ABC transporter substrate-binding protein [Myxococcales bacterium]
MSREVSRRALGRAALAMPLAAASAAGCSVPRRAPGEVALWFSYGGNNRKVLLELVARFHREQTRVKVLPTFQGDYFEGLIKLRTGLFVGRAPTLTHVVGEVVPYLAAAGVLEPIDAVGDEVLNDLEPALSQTGTFEGAANEPLVCLPFNRSTPIAYMNRPLFDTLGLAPPATWEELRAVAKRASDEGAAGKKRWGFECPVDWWFWSALVAQAGGAIITPAGEVELGGEAGVEALTLWRDMVKVERTMKPPPGRDYNAWEATNSDFLAGRAAMIWTSTAFLRYLEDNAPFAVLAAPLPAHRMKGVPTGGTFFVMPRGLGQDERQAGLTFLRWMMQPEQANEWATKTGYLPVSRRGRRDLERAGFFEKHPNFRVAIDQLAHARRWPWHRELFRIQREIVQPRLEAAVLGDAAPATVLAEARELKAG